MESKVTVLTPHGRRQNIKVSPNTTILQILEEACRKYGFDSDNYCLKHHNREVGLTQMFRFSGLPNNCLLEMVETEKRRVAEKVDICIQLEDGTRQLAQFESNESLWSVIQKLTANAVNEFENPVILYMRQEICGKEALIKTSLKSLGIIEGRALLRLVDKRPEELKTQANVYKAPTEKKVVEEASDSSKRDIEKASSKSGSVGGGFSITKDLVKSLKTNMDAVVATATTENSSSNAKKDDGNDGNDDEQKPKYDWGTGKGRSMQQPSNDDTNEQNENMEMEMDVEPEYTIIGERNAILYSLNTGRREITELPDSFYDLTVNDLKLVLRDLKRISTGNEDAPLMTEKLRELEQQKKMLNKIAQYKNCIIRVHLPESFVLQGVFKPSDKAAFIADFVRKFLRDEKAAFALFTIPPKTNLNLDKNLLELDLVPTAVVHFTWEVEPTNPEDRTNVLKPEYLSQLTSIEGAIYAANKFRIVHRSKSVNREDDQDEDDDQPGTSAGAALKRPNSIRRD